MRNFSWFKKNEFLLMTITHLMMHNLSKKQNRKCWKRKSIRVFLNILFEENRSLKSITKALDLIKNHGTQFAQKKCQNFLQNDTDNTREFWTVVVDLVAIQFK